MEKVNLQNLIDNIERVMIGKRDVIELAVITLLSGGHLLMEDVPGVGKTTLAVTLAKSVGCSFGRIQFTPDTLPGVVQGVSIYNMKEGCFEYSKGAIMNQIILADEINRTSPKTQASLLEAMEERQVTVDGTTYPLPRPFMVIATQNPVEYLGTYRLPEAQLDRFFMKVSIGYPKVTEEQDMIGRFLTNESWKRVEAVMNEDDLIQLQEEVKTVRLRPELVAYITEIVDKTRNSEYVTLGASPRASLALARGAQATAYLNGRDFVQPDDVKRIVKPMLCHRLILSPEARAAKMSEEKVVAAIMTKTKVPV